jgi:hypothetical protein
MQLHLSTTDLRRLFAPVIPWAGTDPYLPVLTNVHVYVQGPEIVAETTDRFRLALNRVTPHIVRNGKGGLESSYPDRADADLEAAGHTRVTPDPHIDCMIPTSVMRQMLAMFKPQRRLGWDPIVTLDFTDQTVTASAGPGLADDLDHLTVRAHLGDGEFPKVRQLLAKSIADAAQYPPRVSLNPRYVSAFTPVAQTLKEEVVDLVVRGPKEPILGFVGEGFVGLVMPRRMHVDEERPATSARVAGWSEFLS